MAYLDVYNSCMLPATTYRAERSQNKLRTNLLPHRLKWKELFSTSHTRNEGPTGSEREREREKEDISHRHNQQCEKSEVFLGRAHQTPQRPLMDLTTWTNTGGTRSGRGQHKSG